MQGRGRAGRAQHPLAVEPLAVVEHGAVVLAGRQDVVGAPTKKFVNGKILFPVPGGGA
jgi:hypothetical protein